MPKRKIIKRQKLADKTTEEVMHKLFPKKVVDHVKKVAHEKDVKK
jgi:hypothetical protein